MEGDDLARRVREVAAQRARGNAFEGRRLAMQSYGEAWESWALSLPAFSGRVSLEDAATGKPTAIAGIAVAGSAEAV